MSLQEGKYKIWITTKNKEELTYSTENSDAEIVGKKLFS